VVFVSSFLHDPSVTNKTQREIDCNINFIRQN